MPASKQQQPTFGPVPIKNVAAFMAMTQRLIDRAEHLDGLGCLYGHSGYGKSCSSIFTQNKLGALRVELRESWTKRDFLSGVLIELGRPPRSKYMRIADMADEAIDGLAEDPRRPLLIDEADKAVDKGYVEIIRELQDHSRAPIILIGEEQLPNKLIRFERVHNRVHDWLGAERCDLEDARRLADAYSPKIEIADDLLSVIVAKSDGRVRRIVDNVAHAAEMARNAGKRGADLSLWGARPFRTGEVPLPRPVEPFKKDRRVAA